MSSSTICGVQWWEWLTVPALFLATSEWFVHRYVASPDQCTNTGECVRHCAPHRATFYVEHQAGAGGIKWFVIGLGLFMAISLWVFPRSSAPL